MSRTLLIQSTPNAKVTIPDEARVTFGPFSPPGSSERNYGNFKAVGTLRVYADHSKGADIIFVKSGVEGYRDLSQIQYEEEVAREEGAILWKSDEKGYSREEKVQFDSSYVQPQIEAAKPKRPRRKS